MTTTGGVEKTEEAAFGRGFVSQKGLDGHKAGFFCPLPTKKRCGGGERRQLNSFRLLLPESNFSHSVSYHLVQK